MSKNWKPRELQTTKIETPHANKNWNSSGDFVLIFHFLVFIWKENLDFLGKTLSTQKIDQNKNPRCHHTGPSRTIYSDRFIPSRFRSNFVLFDLVSPKASSIAEGQEDTSSAYATLLHAALFSPKTSGEVAFPATPDKRSTPSWNIFQYKSEMCHSMHLLLPFGFDKAV